MANAIEKKKKQKNEGFLGLLRGLQVEPAPGARTTQEKTNGNGNSDAATANAIEKKKK